MTRRTGNDQATAGVQTQIIAGRDGKPAFALLPLEVFLTLLAYARQGISASPDDDALADLDEWLRKRDFASASRTFREGLHRGWAGGEDRSLRDHLVALLSDDRMNKTFEEVSNWLRASGHAAAHHENGNDEAADIAAYDAAMARDEESFPSEIADRLIAGENPIKIFREYRGLTQKQLARKTATSAPYVSQLETGRRVGSIKLLHRLADALDVGLDDLA